MIQNIFHIQVHSECLLPQELMEQQQAAQQPQQPQAAPSAVASPTKAPAGGAPAGAEKEVIPSGGEGESPTKVSRREEGQARARAFGACCLVPARNRKRCWVRPRSIAG